MGRTDHETCAREVGRRSRRIRQFAGVGGAGSDELSEAAPQRPRRNHSAGRPGPLRYRPQHPAHGLGAPYSTKTGSRNYAQPVALKTASRRRIFGTRRPFQSTSSDSRLTILEHIFLVTSRLQLCENPSNDPRSISHLTIATIGRMTDRQMTDRQMTDRQMTDRQVTDRHVSRAFIAARTQEARYAGIQDEK